MVLLETRIPHFVAIALGFLAVQGAIRAHRAKSRPKSGRSKKWFSRKSNSIFLLP